MNFSKNNPFGLISSDRVNVLIYQDHKKNLVRNGDPKAWLPPSVSKRVMVTPQTLKLNPSKLIHLLDESIARISHSKHVYIVRVNKNENSTSSISEKNLVSKYFSIEWTDTVNFEDVFQSLDKSWSKWNVQSPRQMIHKSGLTLLILISFSLRYTIDDNKFDHLRIFILILNVLRTYMHIYVQIYASDLRFLL